MTATISTHDLLAHPPYDLSPQEDVDALTALSHVLHGEHDKMQARLLDLSPRGRAELATALAELWVAADALVRRAELPAGVEGTHVGSRAER